ncbi:MAG TPA: Mur ligase family protein [Thermoanaerobaculia bacterium]|nr:Mur ligase family protein [Thermoanaerobaculia bacterium]
MKLLESRRLTGPNLLWDRAGAVLDVALSAEERETVPELWARQARRILDAVGWQREETRVRLFPNGASLALSAPIDALYAATEINEWAWTAAETLAHGWEEPSVAEAAERLREEIERERNPALLALRDSALSRGVAFLSDDDHASVGLGTGSLTWPARELPAPEAVDWSRVHDIPVLLVTGTNGKTTTVRLLAAILRAAGKVAGLTSTDHIEVAGEILDRGDFSGPGGARTLLRDPRVEVAILETARGGILRRGLALTAADAADAALVTNIAADHLGDLGVEDLPSLADVKMVITRVVGPGGRVVLNAEDPLLVERAGQVAAPLVWFGLDPDGPVLRRAIEEGGEAWTVEDGQLVRWQAGRREPIVPVAEVPLTFGGAARHNVANALAALALAGALDLAPEALAAGLKSLRNTPEDNPGRANLFEIGGVRLLVDYAHNPHGIAALAELSASLSAERKLMVIGQAGDRDDEAIRDLARAAWQTRPDHIVVKDLPSMLRGRNAGDVPAILVDELRRLGVPEDRFEMAETEIEAVHQALAWARPGDLLILLVHTQRDEVLALLGQLQAAG